MPAPPYQTLPEWRISFTWWKLWGAVIASFILHSLVICIIKVPPPLRPDLSQTPLSLSLRPLPAAQPEPSVAAQPKENGKRYREAASVRARAVGGTDPSGNRSEQRGDGSGTKVSPEHINIEEVRAQVRRMDFAKGQSRDATPPVLQDRVVAPALARALSGSAQVLQETRRADGSWDIRFPSNRCLHVPMNAPSWRESQVVPTAWVVTNCDG